MTVFVPDAKDARIEVLGFEIERLRSQLSIARAALEGIRKLAERESESAEVNVRSKPSIRPVSSASRMHKADRIASISAQALRITDPSNGE